MTTAERLSLHAEGPPIPLHYCEDKGLQPVFTMRSEENPFLPSTSTRPFSADAGGNPTEGIRYVFTQPNEWTLAAVGKEPFRGNVGNIPRLKENLPQLKGSLAQLKRSLPPLEQERGLFSRV
jgi:hypothetical protein